MHVYIKMAIGSIICGASTPKMKRKKAKVYHDLFSLVFFLSFNIKFFIQSFNTLSIIF